MVMTRRGRLRVRSSWIGLLISGLATLGYGGVVVIVDGSQGEYLKAIGAASIGMGLFGAMTTLTAFRRLERWAFFSLWYYPVFWTAHLVGKLPPGRDHIHQVAFILLS